MLTGRSPPLPFPQMASGVSEAYVTVFRPKVPGSKDGPRIWNEQLLSYASYMEDGGKVVGDPKNVSERSRVSSFVYIRRPQCDSYVKFASSSASLKCLMSGSAGRPPSTENEAPTTM